MMVRVQGFFLIIVAVVVTAIGLQCVALDIPLAGLHPGVVVLDPNGDATIKSENVRFPDGSSHSALILKNQLRLTYDIPPGQQSFHATLLRADGGTVGTAAVDLNRIYVRFLLDGTEAYETVLDVTMPPEQLTFPIQSAKKLTIAVDQMLAGGSLYLADAAFSPEEVSRASSQHLLAAGAAYANLGAGVRQVAFRTYRPGEAVPLQAEVGGSATAASVVLTVTSRQQTRPAVLTIPVTLRAGSASSVGEATWQVPSVLGPATLDLQLTLNGKAAYHRAIAVAIARNVDPAKDTADSTFGVHLSSAGIPYLADSVANIWGANWGRVFLRWDVIEFTRGQYDWSRIDEIINLYRSQNIQILGVLGEVPPRWSTSPDAATIAAFQQFVRAAVQHFQGRIRYWDVYNEVDSKYHGGIGLDKTDPSADIHVLRDEMAIIRGAQADSRLVCCSTGTSYWLAYDKRLYDNGLLNSIDILSLHPYQIGPPEQRDGVMNYVEMVNGLRTLERGYGSSKPVWSTEANWLIGPEGQKGVLAPDVTEHQQSQYVVRVNLLSMALAAPYFLHSPWSTPFHRDLLLDVVASYANMTYNFGPSMNAKALTLPAGLYGVVATSGAKTICALWTTRESARVKVSGMNGVHLQDMYGNAVAYELSSVPLSGDPVYLVGSGSPSITAVEVAPGPIARSLPNPWTWEKSLLRKYAQTPEGVRVTSPLTNYGNLLKSPKIDVAPNACYVVSMTLHTYSGGVAIVAVDSATGKRVGSTVDVFNVTGHEVYQPELKLDTKATSQIQIVLIADNPDAQQITDFEVSHSQISPCGGP